MTERTPIKKVLAAIPVEQAHGGAGRRQIVFGQADAVSPPFEAWTKGFLPAGGCYDWHQHDGVDEFFIVLSGTGTIAYQDGPTFDYQVDDAFYNPAGLAHRIDNTSDGESVFYFFRVTV